MTEKLDVLIVGGGMVGNSLACALETLKLKIGLVETTAPILPPSYQNQDGRAIALSYGTQQILSGLSVWPELKSHAMPITHVHVSYQGHFGATRINAMDNDVPALGYVVEANILQQVLSNAMQKTQTTLFAPATVQALEKKSDGYQVTLKHNDEAIQIFTKLLVAADGAQSSLRQMLAIPATTKDYGQSALITNIKVSQPNATNAYERFLKNGTLALLPVNENSYKLVWTAESAEISQLMAQPPKEFLRLAQKAFGYRVGKFLEIGKRWVYPLQQVFVDQQIAPSAIVMGNAAHTLHPIAAQGFNLSLQDIAALTDVLGNAIQHNQDWTNPTVLQHYIDQQQPQQEITRRFTDGLVTWFRPGFKPWSMLSSIGLVTLDIFTPLKNSVAKQAMGLGGKISQLARGIKK